MTNDLTISHKDRAHSFVGGSTAKRVMMCPASVNLCAQYPNVESEFAARGTALHECIDFIFQGRTEKDTDVIGLKFHGHVITEQLFEEAIEPALEMWDALDKELGGIEYFNEKRVVFPGIEGAFGTVDMVGKAKDRACVWDWKFGSGVSVSAEENMQLQYYAYAAANTPGTAELFDRDKPIELFICQPCVREGEPFTRWLTTYRQLEVFAMELQAAVQRSQEPDPEYRMGDWCKFCNAKMGCPLYNNRVEEVRGLSDEQLAAQFEKYAPLFDLMIEWGKAGKAMMHAEMENGLQVPGWKLVNTRATRKWVDEDKTVKYFARMKLPADERYEKKLISPAKAEKALKPLGIAELPKDLVVSESSGTTLAPADDKRPAVVVGAGALKKLAERLSAG